MVVLKVLTVLTYAVSVIHCSFPSETSPVLTFPSEAEKGRERPVIGTLIAVIPDSTERHLTRHLLLGEIAAPKFQFITLGVVLLLSGTWKQ